MFVYIILFQNGGWGSDRFPKSLAGKCLLSFGSDICARIVTRMREWSRVTFGKHQWCKCIVFLWRHNLTGWISKTATTFEASFKLFYLQKQNSTKVKSNKLLKKSNFSATIFSKIDALAQFRFDMLSLTNLLNYLIAP